MKAFAIGKGRQGSAQTFERASSDYDRTAESDPSPLTPVELPYPGGAPRSVRCPDCGKPARSTLGVCRHCGARFRVMLDLSKTVLDRRSPEQIKQAARSETAWLFAIALGAAVLVTSLYEIYGSGRDHSRLRTLLAQSPERMWSISLIIHQSVR